MTFTMLDNNLLDHPKVLMAGPLAAWLFVASQVYSNRYRTNGFLPREAVARLAGSRGAKRHAAKLVEVGLWRESEGGYEIVGLTAHHALQELEAQRRKRLSEVRAAAGRKGGQRNAARLIALDEERARARDGVAADQGIKPNDERHAEGEGGQP